MKGATVKKPVLTVASLVAACVCAFAQGKVSFVNDSLHLVYFDPAFVKAGDASLEGQPVPTTPTPSGTTFTIGLYAGTSSTALTLRGTTGFTSPGRFGPTTIALSDVAAPNSAFFQVAVWDSAFADPLSAQSAGTYYDFSQIFTANTGSITPDSIVNHSLPSNSTWADGFFNMDYYAVGARGALDIAYVPEPGTLALVGLSAAMFLIWGRRSKGK
jgi:hypothetical protein